MSQLKGLALKMGGLVATLWGAATLLFLFSRLLPAGSTPQGMQELDTSVYGRAGTQVENKIKEEYLRRTGAHLPLFYFKVVPLGWKLAKAKPLSQSPFYRTATLWHGQQAAKQFLHEWQKLQSQPTQDKRLIHELSAILARWSVTKSPQSRKVLGRQFASTLQKIAHKQRIAIARAWLNLQKSKSAWWYFTPSLQWTGSNNQYHLWLTGILTGNLGTSLIDYRPVLDKSVEALALSASIGIPGLLGAICLSFLLGFWLTLTERRYMRQITKQFLYLVDSVPGFMITLGLFALFLLSGGSLMSGSMDEIQVWSSTSLLANVCLMLFILPHLTILFHHNLLQESGKAYLRTAQAKGLSYRQAMLYHAIPNALSASITAVSEILASLLAGVIIVEITFSLPGSGSLLAKSILTQDYPTVIGLSLFLLFLRTTILWSSDVLNAFIDPRMRTK